MNKSRHPFTSAEIGEGFIVYPSSPPHIAAMVSYWRKKTGHTFSWIDCGFGEFLVERRPNVNALRPKEDAAGCDEWIAAIKHRKTASFEARYDAAKTGPLFGRGE